MTKDDPDESKAWNEGYRARLNKERDDACPYQEGTREDADWIDGYLAADWQIERTETSYDQ